jgi:hypothetical protein
MAEILAAVALAASAVQGEADCSKVDGDRVGPFQIYTRQQATGHSTPRDREWLLDSLSNSALAAVALTHMNGLKEWPEYVLGAHCRYLPEAFPPPIRRPEDGVPYQEATVFPGLPLRLLMRACGWIAPSNADAERIARTNGFPTAADVPAGAELRIPVQRGW